MGRHEQPLAFTVGAADRSTPSIRLGMSSSSLRSAIHMPACWLPACGPHVVTAREIGVSYAYHKITVCALSGIPSLGVESGCASNVLVLPECNGGMTSEAVLLSTGAAQ